MTTTEIIIVNWNNRAETLECVRAVEAQLPERAGTSITVVDNGSTDGSPAAIAAQHPRVKLFALKENRGFTGGLAAALAGSTATHVIFLNNDAVPQAGWLVAFADAMDAAADDVIAIGGKIVDPTGTKIDFIGGMLTFDGHAFQNGFRYPLGSRPEPAAGDEILFACGGNMILRRAPFMELGAFDDDFFAYLEDVDFGWRCWIAGYRVTFAPDAIVRHAASTTSNRLGDFERGVLFERNALQTAIKNYENLPASGASVLFAYLHRLHHYATTRNAGAQELTRDFRAPSKRRRWRRKPLVTIEDPLTAMQFRALEWILQNDARLARKRHDVQQRRKRADREIFERFPLQFVPTYPGDERLMQSALFQLLRPSLPAEDRTLQEIMKP
jgi:GT2 family glycosyltransferase